MKRRLTGILVCLSVLLCVAAAQAAPQWLVRNHARHAIERTAVVLVAAQKAARAGHKYDGLARAVAHQLFAREMYARERYHEAIHHSLRARALAVDVIRANGAKLLKEANLDALEKNYANESPPGEELDLKIVALLGQDKMAVFVRIELDID